MHTVMITRYHDVLMQKKKKFFSRFCKLLRCRTEGPPESLGPRQDLLCLLGVKPKSTICSSRQHNTFAPKRTVPSPCNSHRRVPRVHSAAISRDETALPHAFDATNYKHAYTSHGSSQLLSVLTDMHATRNAFRSLRSFTLAARHHSTASEIVSDPIVDDDHVPTPGTHNSNRENVHPPVDDIVVDSPTRAKLRHVSTSSMEDPLRPFLSDPQPLQGKDSNCNQVNSSNETHLLSFNSALQHKSPSVLSEPASTLPTRYNSSQNSAKYQHTQRKHHTPGKRTSDEQPLPSTSLNNIGGECPVQNKTQHDFDIEEVVDQPASPPVKRRRTRSSTRQNRQSSPSPEVDKLHYRQLLDNATEEGRRAILAASESSRGRRKRRQLVDEDEDHMQREEETLSIPLKDGDVQWLGTSYDSVEEVAPTPSPQTKRKRHSDRPRRGIDGQKTPRRARHTIVEHIDTSESPQRIMRRRSRRLGRDINRASAKMDPKRQVEAVDSSSSPVPKKRRSRRLARVAELSPTEETGDSDNSNHSEVSRENAVEKAVNSNKVRKGKRAFRSRPLPKPQKGLLRERLRRRMPILPTKKIGKKKATSHHGGSTDLDSSAPRRSTRLRKSRARRQPVVDVDGDDEIIEEGSADNGNEGDGSNFEADKETSAEEEELIVEEVGDDEDEEDSEIQFDEDEDDDEDINDEEDEEDEEDFEERAWKEQLKLKQIRRKKKRNGRRKRTQPRDVFRTEGEYLTAREQKQRLDFLVQQSAEIASHLHGAMGELVRDAGEATKNKIGGAPNSTNGDVDRNHPAGESDAMRKKENFVLPSGAGCDLQPHQKDGVDWLLTLDSQGLNAILADEMGLGKTIQAISFLASLVLSGSRGPHLVIAPKNVCQHWADETRKWYPTELTLVTHMGNSEDRLERLQHVLEEDNFDILVTSFDTALADLFTRKRRDGVSWEHLQVLRAFRKVEFEYLVVDEAHRLKNDCSRTNRAIRGYNLAQRRLLLTGTPLSNDLKELWSLMNVLNPRIFSSKATFEAWFSAPFASKTKKHSKVSLTHAEQSVIVDRLHTVIRPFFRRRVRADICPTFTSADEVVIRCPLSGLQRAILLHLQRRSMANESGMRNVLMAMRAASNHPYTVSDALFDGEQSLDSERLVASSGKFVFLHFALLRLINTGHRVLIFSQFKRVLDFIEDLLIILSLKFARLDGDTLNDDRTNGLSEFNRDGSDIPVFLLTTRAGGIGLNLQTADTVILFDSDWNPSADLQAVSRIQRIGQKRTVHILRLVTEKSVDDVIVETARHKLRTQSVAVGAGKFNTSMGAALDTRMRQKDLEELLKRLESQNYADDHDEVIQGASQENSSPESLSPRRVSRTAQNRCFAEWGKQLLRKGEPSLSSVDIAPIWIDNAADSSDRCIPPWLTKEADLASAAKALRCTDISSANRVYEECLLLKTEAGRLSKKDRATRARRQTSVIEISDADSEVGTERSNDVDWVGNSGSESDDDDPGDETVTEEQKPKKVYKYGLCKNWADKQVRTAMPLPEEAVPAASAPIGSSPARRPFNSVPIQDRSNTHGFLHVSGEANKSSLEASNVWGSPLVSVPNRSGSSQQRVALPTAHHKRFPPDNRASGFRRKAKNLTENCSHVRDGASSKVIRGKEQPVPMVAHSQQNVLLNNNLSARNVPLNLREPSGSATTLAHKPVRQSMLAPVPVLPPQVGLSARGVSPAIPVVGQHGIATTRPVPLWGLRVAPNQPHVQEEEMARNGSATNSARLSRCAIQPTPVRTGALARAAAAQRVRNSAPSKPTVPKKDKSRRPIFVTSREVEIASSDDFSVVFWQEDIGVATKETVSLRPTLKRGRSLNESYTEVDAVANNANGSSVQTDIKKEKKPPKPANVSNSLPGVAATRGVSSVKRISAEQFAASVKRLKEMTNVLDTQFLEDALLDCGYDIEAAKEMVLQQIR